jgi:hypothetical protein
VFSRGWNEENDMKGYQNRDRFIPYRKADVAEMCITDARLSDSDQNLFRDFCRILESLIHFEFNHQLETVKNCYAPFNPDADTRSIHTYSPQERQTLQKKLVESMTAILNAANFEKVTETDLKEAVLAYYFLLTEDRDLTRGQLDAAVESWFETEQNCSINFEIADALRKLERLDLVSRDGDILRCKSLNDAKRQLDMIWDNYFIYYQANESLKTLGSGPR